MRRGLAGICVVMGLFAEACSCSGTRHAPAVLGVVFEIGTGEQVDTFRRVATVTRRYMSGRDTTIALDLTAAEVDRIYRKVAEERLFDVPELRAPTTCFSIPASSFRLLIRTDTNERRFQWDSWWACSDSVRATKAWSSLMSLVHTIQGIIEARPEYKALPPSDIMRI
jgi:hypothetical protein